MDIDIMRVHDKLNMKNPEWRSHPPERTISFSSSSCSSSLLPLYFPRSKSLCMWWTQTVQPKSLLLQFFCLLKWHLKESPRKDTYNSFTWQWTFLRKIKENKNPKEYKAMKLKTIIFLSLKESKPVEEHHWHLQTECF